MARSWRRPESRPSTASTGCPTASRAVSTSTCAASRAGPCPDRAGRRASKRCRKPCRTLGAARAIGQQLFDTFCRDLDDNLRENGGRRSRGAEEMASPKRFTAVKLPMSRPWLRRIAGSLRTRSRGISLTVQEQARERCGLPLMSARRWRSSGNKVIAPSKLALLRGRVEFQSRDYADCRGRQKWVSKP